MTASNLTFSVRILKKLLVILQYPLLLLCAVLECLEIQHIMTQDNFGISRYRYEKRITKNINISIYSMPCQWIVPFSIFAFVLFIQDLNYSSNEACTSSSERLSISLSLTTGLHSLILSHSFGVGSCLWGLQHLDAHCVSLGSWSAMGTSGYSVLTFSGQFRASGMTLACGVPLQDFLSGLQCYDSMILTAVSSERTLIVIRQDMKHTSINLFVSSYYIQKNFNGIQNQYPAPCICE